MNDIVLEYVPEALKHDKEVVFAAGRQNPEALRYAPDEIRNDKEAVLAVVGKSLLGLIRVLKDPMIVP